MNFIIFSAKIKKEEYRCGDWPSGLRRHVRDVEITSSNLVSPTKTNKLFSRDTLIAFLISEVMPPPGVAASTTPGVTFNHF